MKREILVDTETTGLNPIKGDRVVEIACVEMISRRFTGKTFHYYLNPQRKMDAAAFAVHGLSDEFLADKKTFKEIADELLDFIRDATLVIHNAPFDVGFLNHELMLLAEDKGVLTDYCEVFDTLKYSRQLNPGGKHSLDALCKRYGIDNSKRELHGALIDAEILGRVYLAMTSGQTNLFDADTFNEAAEEVIKTAKTPLAARPTLKIIHANAAELAAHQQYFSSLETKK